MAFENKNVLIYGPGIKSKLNNFDNYDYIILFNEQYKILHSNVIPENKNIILFINVGMMKNNQTIKTISCLYDKIYKIFFKDDVFLENVSLTDNKYDIIRDKCVCIKRPWSGSNFPQAPVALGIFWILKYFLSFKNVKCYITGIDFYKRDVSYENQANYSYTVDKNSHGFKNLHNPDYQIYIFKNIANKHKNIILLDDFLKNLLTNLK